MIRPTTDAEVVYSATTVVDETKKNESKFKLPAFKVKAPQIKALQPPDRSVILRFILFFFKLPDKSIFTAEQKKKRKKRANKYL